MQRMGSNGQASNSILKTFRLMDFVYPLGWNFL